MMYIMSLHILFRGVPRGVLRVLEHPHQPDLLTNVFFQLECS